MHFATLCVLPNHYSYHICTYVRTYVSLDSESVLYGHFNFGESFFFSGLALAHAMGCGLLHTSNVSKKVSCSRLCTVTRAQSCPSSGCINTYMWQSQVENEHIPV